MLKFILLFGVLCSFSNGLEQERHFSNMLVRTLKIDGYDDQMVLEGTAYSYCPTSKNYTVKVRMLEYDFLTGSDLIGKAINMNVTDRKAFHVMMGVALSNGPSDNRLSIFFRIEHDCPKTRKDAISPGPRHFTFGYFPEAGYIDVGYHLGHATHIYNMFWDLTVVGRTYDVPMRIHREERIHAGNWSIYTTKLVNDPDEMELGAVLHSYCPFSKKYNIKIEMLEYDFMTGNDLIGDRVDSTVSNRSGEHQIVGVAYSDGIGENRLDIVFRIEHNCPRTKEIAMRAGPRPVTYGFWPEKGYIEVDYAPGHQSHIYNIYWDLTKVGRDYELTVPREKDSLVHMGNCSIWTTKVDNHPNDMVLEAYIRAFCPTSKHYHIKIEMIEYDSLSGDDIIGNSVDHNVTSRQSHHLLRGIALSDGPLDSQLEIYFNIEHNCPKTKQIAAKPGPRPISKGFYPVNNFIQVEHIPGHNVHLYNIFWDLSTMGTTWSAGYGPSILRARRSQPIIDNEMEFS